MSAGIENNLKNDEDDGDKQDYLLSKEETQVLLGILCLDLKNICHKIEDNFVTTDGSSF